MLLLFFSSQGHYRERQSQNLLLSNLEMIKTSFERSESEAKMRMETRLDHMTQECSGLRRRLKE
jgi:nucleoprotein TPR